MSPQPKRNKRKKKAPRRPNVVKKSALRKALARARVRSRHMTHHTARVTRPAWRPVGQAVVVAAMVGASLAIIGGLKHYAANARAFTIVAVGVEGHKRLSPLHIKRVSRQTEGRNIFEVSAEDAENRLKNDPWISDAKVVRRLPSTVSIRVVEHKPVALVALERLYLVNDKGDLFKQVGVDDPVDLPVITGVETQRFAQDASYRRDTIIGALSLLVDYRRAGLFEKEPIGEVHVESDGALTLYVGRDAAQVRLGHGPYRAKLRRLTRVLRRLSLESKRPGYVYLDNVRRPHRVTVAPHNTSSVF